MSLHEKLKNTTKASHDFLESKLNLQNPHMSLEDYQDILKKFYGYYRPLEENLELDDKRRKIPHLLSDLKYFKIDPESLPLAQDLPQTQSHSQKFGVKYVLEGSTLGGMVLTRYFKEKFGLSPDEGLSFFSGYQEQTVPMWKNFLQELNSFGESSRCEEEQVTTSAQSTFDTLSRWLTRQDVP